MELLHDGRCPEGGASPFRSMSPVLFQSDSGAGASPVAQTVKKSTCNAGDPDSILGQEDPLEKGMATHSSILARRTPLTDELAGYSPWSHKDSD